MSDGKKPRRDSGHDEIEWLAELRPRERQRPPRDLETLRREHEQRRQERDRNRAERAQRDPAAGPRDDPRAAGRMVPSPPAEPRRQRHGAPPAAPAPAPHRPPEPQAWAPGGPAPPRTPPVPPGGPPREPRRSRAAPPVAPPVPVPPREPRRSRAAPPVVPPPEPARPPRRSRAVPPPAAPPPPPRTRRQPSTPDSLSDTTIVPPAAPPKAPPRPPSRRAAPGPARSTAPATAPAGPGRGAARSELRRHLKDLQRLRLATLGLVTLLLLGALPAFFLIREAARDPVFRALDSLDVPSWAAQRPADEAVGNRWCVRTCRVRKRTWSSEREPATTALAFDRALRAQGWRPWSVIGCPAQPVDGYYTCWRRDEYTLDLYVTTGECGSGIEACPVALATVVVRNRSADDRR